VKVEAPASAATPEVVEQDSAPTAVPRTVRTGRGGDAGSSASTPKRSARGAAARG